MEKKTEKKTDYNWVQPGIPVWYYSSPERRFSAVVDSEPWKLGNHTWVVNLRDLGKAYQKINNRSTVNAAGCRSLKPKGGELDQLKTQNKALKKENKDWEKSFDLYWKASHELIHLFPHTKPLVIRDAGQLNQLAADEIRTSRETIQSLEEILNDENISLHLKVYSAIEAIRPLNNMIRNRNLLSLDTEDFELEDNNLSRLVLACKYLFEQYTMADDCHGLRLWWKNNKHRFG